MRFSLQSSQPRLFIFSVLITALFLITLANIGLNPTGSTLSYFDFARPDSSSKSHEDDGSQAYTLGLPPEYKPEEQSPYCDERFSSLYLERLRDSVTGYCSPESPSSLNCFYSNTSDSQVDSFCIGKQASFDFAQDKFMLHCHAKNETTEVSRRPSSLSALLSRLPSYWYETGPRIIFDRFIEIDDNLKAPVSSKNYTILIKREGETNPWHSLMEIFSMTMTLDVLRMTPETPGGPAFFTSENDIANTQIVILDNREDGPYFDFWKLFAGRPTIRIGDIPEGEVLENIIVPLPGASNPMWQADWKPHSCQSADLLRTFMQRAIDFYGVDDEPPREGSDIVVTFIDRIQSRRLTDQETFLEEVRRKFQHVTVQAVDFGAIPFKDQLEITRKTDILVGVHGAGLTHGMFLRPNSAMVEILPASLNYKGFRNLAGLLGHAYYSAHAEEPSVAKRGSDWLHKDVFMSKDRFLNLMDVAIKSLYNKGERNYDVN